MPIDFVTEMLLRARRHRGLVSDRQLAIEMGVTPQTLSQWKARDVPLSEERVLQLAELANENGGQWLLRYRAETASTPEMKATWLAILDVFEAKLIRDYEEKTGEKWQPMHIM